MSTSRDACEKHGMQINTKKNKTEVTLISKESEKCSIYLNEEKINQTETFFYPGMLITEDGKCIKEIKSRIAQSKTAFTNLKKILTNKKTLSKLDLEFYVATFGRYFCMRVKHGHSILSRRSSLKVLKCGISEKWSAYHTQRTKPMILF